MTKAQGGHRQLPGVFFCGPGGEWERERERLPDTSWQTKATGGKTECKGDMHWGGEGDAQSKIEYCLPMSLSPITKDPHSSGAKPLPPSLPLALSRLG